MTPLAVIGTDAVRRVRFSFDPRACVQIIAREVVNSNKAVSRLHTQKAYMMDMEMALKHQLGAPHLSLGITYCRAPVRPRRS